MKHNVIVSDKSLLIFWCDYIKSFFYFAHRTWKSKKGEVGRAVKLALQFGYQHIDCAHVYQNEDEIGETFTEVFKEGKLKREDVFVTSKLW